MKQFSTRFSLVASAVLASTFFAPAYGARVYFTDQPAGTPGSVISVNLDGTDQRTVTTVSNAPDLRGIAYHRASGRIYFLDNGAAKKIYSILPDGSDQQEVTPVDPALIDSDVEIDETAGKIYWSESNAGATGNGLIRRANLNGTQVETIVTTAPGVATTPYFIFLDPPAGYVYWGVLSQNSDPGTFRRATLADGIIDPSFSITSPTRSRDIAVDPRSSLAYWCDRQTGAIYKRALSGGANQLVISGLNAPHGIALDLEAEKIYFADTGARGSGSQSSSRRVSRCNFDGTGFELLSTPAPGSEPWDLALDTSSPTYADWRARFFSANAPLAQPADDADEDGAENLLEYAMGTDPRKAASVPLIGSAGTGLKYTRRRGSNLAYTVEVSTNLNFSVWNYNGDGSGLVWTTESSVTAIDTDYESVIVAPGAALAGQSKAFFRVRVSMP